MIAMEDLIPIVVSLVALFVSMITLYMLRFRPGKIHVVVGEHALISHEPAGIAEGCVRLILPLNIANAGSRHLTVERVALLIQNQGKREGYLLEPTFYVELAKSGTYEYGALSDPITVFGGENVNKQVMFASSTERPNEFQMTTAGSYDLTLVVWSRGTTKSSESVPIFLEVSKEQAADIASHIKEKKADSTKVRQTKWRDWDAHHLKAPEVENLKKGAGLRHW